MVVIEKWAYLTWFCRKAPKLLEIGCMRGRWESTIIRTLTRNLRESCHGGELQVNLLLDRHVVGSEEVWRRQSVLFAEGGRLQQVALLGLRSVALACHHQHWLLAVNKVFLKRHVQFNYFFCFCWKLARIMIYICAPKFWQKFMLII